jgi:predicted peptidase
MKFLLFTTTLAMLATTASSASPAPAQTTERATLQVSFPYTYNYLLGLPAGYADEENADERWPLLLFLHGMGERGDDLQKIRRHGPPRLLDEDGPLPFVVVSPQCPDDEWWNLPALEALIDELVRRHRIDPDRIYLTGLSMGGYGTWALAARNPARYAAIIPVCGGGETKWAPRLRDLPIWAFHGGQDTVVPPARSQEMVDAIRVAGGSPKLTIYPEAGHDSWTETYANDEIYTWLLSHRRRR